MPSELIYREDAKDYARHAMAKGLNALEYLDEVPAADFRPVVRGEWGKSLNPNFSPFDDSGEYLYRCNQCRHIQNYESNFCPNCGADMREES
jgi:hypothetical protein